MDLNGKKVLQMGLGILGGGVATARFLVEKGAILTVTDLKGPKDLLASLDRLADIKSKINFVLGEHRDEDFLNNEIIVINPDVPYRNRLVNLARGQGKMVENELTIFYQFCESKNTVAVTGTRGKTTTVNWIFHLLKNFNPDTVLLGNSPEKPFLQEIKKITPETWVVMEVPSYQLEIVNKENFKTHIALITNLYRDHINRHRTIEEYARTKANIFRGQTSEDFLILNKDNEWTEFFLDEDPKAGVTLFTDEIDGTLVDQKEFIKKWGEHNLLNLAAAISVAKKMRVSDESIRDSIPSLPQIKFRQEKVLKKENLEIYNDTTATSPEATIAALERFKDEENLILIAGGTDRELDFKDWASAVNKNLKKENLILLAGSATEKMKKELGWESFNEFETLKNCLAQALELAKATPKAAILFSPGCKSFEKFKNEFDRGEQFNNLVKNLKVV